MNTEIFGNSGDLVVVSNEGFNFHGAAAFGTEQGIELEDFSCPAVALCESGFINRAQLADGL